MKKHLRNYKDIRPDPYSDTRELGERKVIPGNLEPVDTSVFRKSEAEKQRLKDLKANNGKGHLRPGRYLRLQKWRLEKGYINKEQFDKLLQMYI